MLIRFSVKNYRSFRGEQVFSLEAGRQAAGHKGRTFESGAKGAPKLLHGAVVYSANSAGKTNFVRALNFFKEFVEHSARGNLGDEIDVTPYRLDPVCLNQPSEFEIVFAAQGSVYQYGFAVDRQRVHSEWLYETPHDGRIRHIFNRESSEKGDPSEWYINPRVRGERKVWQDSTRPNALFLSTAVQLNSHDLLTPYDWIKNKFVVLLGSFFSEQYTAHVCHDHDQKSSVLEMLRAVDLGVVDIDIEEHEWDEQTLPKDFPEEVRSDIVKQMKGRTIYDTEVIRLDRSGARVKFDLDDESTGTNLLFSLAGPWLDTLCNGYTLVIDELDSGLHPLVLKALVSMFFDPMQNTSNAQLVITCHEATLMQDEFLRSDQIWFIDRNERDGSKLYPMSEFRPRRNESYLRGYLGGRYGGIPLPPSTH